MRLRALFVLLVVAFSASDVGAQIGDATGLIPPRAAVPADNADLRTDDEINGSSWQINARLPEPRGSSQGATVASSDGSLIYSVGGGCCHSDYPDGINRLWAYSPKDDSWSAAADVPVSDGIRAYGNLARSVREWMNGNSMSGIPFGMRVALRRSGWLRTPTKTPGVRPAFRLFSQPHAVRRCPSRVNYPG